MAYATGYYLKSDGRPTKIHIISGKKGGPICGSRTANRQFQWIAPGVIDVNPETRVIVQGHTHLEVCTKCYKIIHEEHVRDA